MTLVRRALGSLVTGCLVWVAVVYGQSEPPSDDRIMAAYAEEAPRVDGILDEAIWQQIAPVTAFTQVWPHEGLPPTEYSEVRIAYNRDFLFFAFTFRDREPHLIRAKNLERGGRNDRDDNAYIAIDTYLDKRNAYLFEMNALGTQDDATITDEGLTFASFSWNSVFKSETAIDDRGWTMEVSIPFRQLRFPKGDELTFGLMLARTINRKNERVIWPEIGLEYGGRFGVLAAVSQYGTLTGLNNVRRGRNIEIKPYLITGLQSIRPNLQTAELQRAFKRELGADVKYGITSNLTMDLSVNTDFAQVEADNVQLNLTRFSLFFPEKREFFLERSGLFEHGNSRTTQTFFSRRIGLSDRILAGIRLTGQMGPLSLGFMNIETGDNLGQTFGGKSANNTVVRLRATLFPRATAGIIMTNLQQEEGSNTAIGLDAQYRFWSSSEFGAWYTRVGDSEEGTDGAAGHTSLRLLNDTYGASASFTSVGTHYYPALGFVRRRDQRRYFASARYTPVVEMAMLPFVRQFRLEGDYTHITGQDGELQSSGISLTAGMDSHHRDGFEVAIERSFERLESSFSIRPDVSIGTGDYRYTQVSLEGDTDSSRPLYAYAGLSSGGFFSGTRTNVRSGVGYRPSRHLGMEADLSYSLIDIPVRNGRFSATTMSFSMLGAASRKLFAKVLVQFDNFTRDLQANIRVDWIHTPGSDLFLVFNTTHHLTGRHDQLFDPRREVTMLSRVGVVKLTYLMLL